MRLRTDFLWIASGRIATALVAIASLRIMTSLLEPKEYGIFALLMAFNGFCGLFLINPVGQHINRHTHAWWDDGTLFQRLSRYNRYILAVSAGIALMVMTWWAIYPDTDKTVTASALAGLSVSGMVYVGTWNVTLVYILNMIGFRAGSVFWMTASSIISLAFSTVLTIQFNSASSWLLGQVIGMLTGAIGAGIMLKRSQDERNIILNGSNAKPILVSRQDIKKYCLPLAAATGLMWLQNSGYRFWVGGAWGAAELGILVVGLSISSQLWAVAESFSMQFLNPYFYRHITGIDSNDHSSLLLSDMVNVMWPLYAVFAGFNILVASSLLNVLTDERYHTAVIFVMFGALLEFARCTANLWSYAAQIQGHTTRIILPYGLGAMIVWSGMIGCSYFGGSLKTLAFVLVVSGIATCAAMVALMQQMTPVTLDVHRWLAASAIMVVYLVLLIAIPIQGEGLLQNFVILLAGGLITGGFMTALLWRNLALKRLMSVSLRGASA